MIESHELERLFLGVKATLRDGEADRPSEPNPGRVEARRGVAKTGESKGGGLTGVGRELRRVGLESPVLKSSQPSPTRLSCSLGFLSGHDMARDRRRALNTITDFSPRGVSLSMEIVKVIFGLRSSTKSSRMGRTEQYTVMGGWQRSAEWA
jgi:hypothetical protein